MSIILRWADAYHRRNGDWPNCYSGEITDASGETWNAVQQALVKGHRGMPGGDSLARFLARHRNARNRSSLPPYTKAKILKWADAHHRRTGRWPKSDSGRIREAAGETWTAVQKALADGRRGMRGGSSLARFLATHRGVRNRMALPALTKSKILSWADAHHRRTGRWPTVWSGQVANARAETWRAVHEALYFGCRGLKGGTTLAKLLADQRGKQSHLDPPDLSPQRVLRWARSYRKRFGDWPGRRCGAIPESPGETWLRIDNAFKRGSRGLPKSSLFLFLYHRK